jgi:hypothetical protein
MGPAPGKGDVAGMGRHGVGSLGQHHPDLPFIILVERNQHASLREVAGFWIGVEVMEPIPHR